MDRRRRNVWLTGIIIGVLMVVFPPWLYVDDVNPNQKSAGYHFLFGRPSVKSYEEMFGFVPDDKMPTKYVRVRLNGIRLTSQILTVVFFAFWRGIKLRGDSQASSAPFLALGICCVVVFILLVWIEF